MITTSTQATISTLLPEGWAPPMGYAHGTLVEHGTRTLHVAGQLATAADGTPLHAGDLGAQARVVMDNIETVLATAGMSLADVVRYDVYTTDVQTYLQHGAAVVAGRFAEAGRIPCGGILAQVVALAYPGMELEVVVTASR